MLCMMSHSRIRFFSMGSVGSSYYRHKHPGQLCKLSCRKASQSTQKTWWQSGQANRSCPSVSSDTPSPENGRKQAAHSGGGCCDEATGRGVDASTTTGALEATTGTCEFETTAVSGWTSRKGGTGKRW